MGYCAERLSDKTRPRTKTTEPAVITFLDLQLESMTTCTPTFHNHLNLSNMFATTYFFIYFFLSIWVLDCKMLLTYFSFPNPLVVPLFCKDSGWTHCPHATRLNDWFTGAPNCRKLDQLIPTVPEYNERSCGWTYSVLTITTDSLSGRSVHCEWMILKTRTFQLLWPFSKDIVQNHCYNIHQSCLLSCWTE